MNLRWTKEKVDLDDIEYVWVPCKPTDQGSIGGCDGCDFRKINVRCSQVPCHHPQHRKEVAKIISIKDLK